MAGTHKDVLSHKDQKDLLQSIKPELYAMETKFDWEYLEISAMPFRRTLVGT
jgi:hypothetical protein